MAGAGSFMQGMANGMGLGMQMKNFQKNKTNDDPANKTPAQNTEQNWAANATSNMGLPSYGGESMLGTVQGQEGTKNAIQTGVSGAWQNILGIIGGGGSTAAGGASAAGGSGGAAGGGGSGSGFGLSSIFGGGG